MKRRGNRQTEEAPARPTKRSRTKGPDAANTAALVPQLLLSDIPSELLWNVVYPLFDVRSLLNFAATSKENLKMISKPLFMASIFEGRLLFSCARELRHLAQLADNKSNQKKIADEIARGLKQLEDFKLQIFDETDFIVVFHCILRDDLPYVTEENEEQVLKKREEESVKKALATKEAVAKAKGRNAKAAITKAAAAEADTPNPLHIHPLVEIKRLKEQFVRLSLRDVTFFTLERPPADINSDEDSDEWPQIDGVTNEWLVEHVPEKPGEHKRLLLEVIIDTRFQTQFVCRALNMSGPRIRNGIICPGFCTRGIVRLLKSFQTTSPEGFREDFVEMMMEHSKSAQSTIFNFFDDFIDESRSLRALNQPPDIMSDKRVHLGMTFKTVKEIFGPVTKVRHYPEVNTYKTRARLGNMVGDCFFLFLVSNPDSLSGLRWQFSTPTSFVPEGFVNEFVKHCKENVARAKKAFGKPANNFGAMTISSTKEAITKMDNTMPLRALHNLFPFLRLFDDSVDFFGIGFKNGARLYSYALYVPQFEGRIELAFSYVPYDTRPKEVDE